jgi:hypothetical protein
MLLMTTDPNKHYSFCMAFWLKVTPLSGSTWIQNWVHIIAKDLKQFAFQLNTTEGSGQETKKSAQSSKVNWRCFW